MSNIAFFLSIPTLCGFTGSGTLIDNGGGTDQTKDSAAHPNTIHLIFFNCNSNQVNDMKNSPALLLIDIQNDYFPGGRMELAGADEAARQAAAVLQCCRDKQLPIVHIAHEAIQPGATFFLPGTEGRKIHPLVQPRDGEMVVTKNFPNSFKNTPLLEILQQLKVRRLIIVGMMTHMCVDATARAAKDLGFHCTLVHDATATRDLVFAGNQVPASQVRTAFTAALSAICDATLSADEIIRKPGGEGQENTESDSPRRQTGRDRSGSHA